MLPSSSSYLPITTVSQYFFCNLLTELSAGISLHHSTSNRQRRHILDKIAYWTNFPPKYNMHWLSSKSQHWILRTPESKPRLPGVSEQIKNPVSLGWLSVALAALHLVPEVTHFVRTCNKNLRKYQPFVKCLIFGTTLSNLSYLQSRSPLWHSRSQCGNIKVTSSPFF